MNKNLVLTGMMGVGKSTIGKKLAKKLKFKFIDIDFIIEKKERKKIDEIFKTKGEKYFRKIEEKTTLKFLDREGQVISLGGGSFLNKKVRNKALSSSVTVWMDLSIKFILKRLKNVKKRPLLDGKDLENSFGKIYNDRKKIYSQANFKIKCDFKNVNEIIKKINNLYESTRNKV